MVIRNRLIKEGGWLEHAGASCFNLYKPPRREPGDASNVAPWLEHLNILYGDYSEHIVRWLAFKVQHPEIKINHALVFGGLQGIGKDTLLEPVKYAVGPWHFREVAPHLLFGRFNSFLKSVILRVSEGRDLGDQDRFKFYDHMKTCTAAPPDVLLIDEQHLREYSVLNCCGIIITTNYKTDGIYLPADDRRHFVAWCDLTKEDFDVAYWNKLWGWYENGGLSHVAAYLAEYDMSDFNPKAPPPTTQAFWDIVEANKAPEEGELADIFDKLGNPDATTLDDEPRPGYSLLPVLPGSGWTQQAPAERPLGFEGAHESAVAELLQEGAEARKFFDAERARASAMKRQIEADVKARWA
jgi:hypothetical protein